MATAAARMPAGTASNPATHEYLELDPGADFDSQIVVKTNLHRRAAEGRSSWASVHGTAWTVAWARTPRPYQRAEGRFLGLMPGIIDALARFRTPLSILTRGTLLRRDLPLIAAAAQRGSGLSVAISLAVGDPDLHRDVEPGTPSPQARLSLITGSVLPACPAPPGSGVRMMVAPVLPHHHRLGRAPDSLLGQILEPRGGATGVTVFGPAPARPSLTVGLVHVRPIWPFAPRNLPTYRRLYLTAEARLPAEYRAVLRARCTTGRQAPAHRGDHRPVNLPYRHRQRERSAPQPQREPVLAAAASGGDLEQHALVGGVLCAQVNRPGTRSDDVATAPTSVVPPPSRTVCRDK